MCTLPNRLCTVKWPSEWLSVLRHDQRAFERSNKVSVQLISQLPQRCAGQPTMAGRRSGFPGGQPAGWSVTWCPTASSSAIRGRVSRSGHRRPVGKRIACRPGHRYQGGQGPRSRLQTRPQRRPRGIPARWRATAAVPGPATQRRLTAGLGQTRDRGRRYSSHGGCNHYGVSAPVAPSSAGYEAAPYRLTEPSGRGALEERDLGGQDGPDAPAVAEVVDIVDKPAGPVVHLRILPGQLEDYQAVIQRAVIPA